MLLLYNIIYLSENRDSFFSGFSDENYKKNCYYLEYKYFVPL